MEDREAEFVDSAKYVTLLEEHLAKSTATSHCQEGQLWGLHVWLDLAEDRAMAVEENATTIEAVMEATKKEVTQAIVRYKALTEFEDEVRDAIYDALFKGFEECKKKMAWLFHLLDLHDIILDELEEAASEQTPPCRLIQWKLPSLRLTRLRSKSPREPWSLRGQPGQAWCGRQSHG